MVGVCNAEFGLFEELFGRPIDAADGKITPTSGSASAGKASGRRSAQPSGKGANAEWTEFGIPAISCVDISLSSKSLCYVAT